MCALTVSTALASGGTHGKSGTAPCLEFVQAGAAVVVPDLDLRKGLSVADDIQAVGGRVSAVSLDVRGGNSITRCVQTAMDFPGFSGHALV